RLAWIEHIESKFPFLRNVSSMRMEEQQKELLHLVEEKQKLSHDILLSKAREKVYDDVVFNRLNNRVTYRDLHHQVTKKKKIWPLRKLLSEFADEIFRVLPCWMASPESVSAIFPMKEMFDIVIFDEASQCFAERGIPAMYRGKQLVVAGDDKQLKPNELYQIRWEEDNGDLPELEVDSLLDLSERYLPTVHLQGHYRSQSMELIDFSNKHFYEGRLKLLPDRNILNLDEPAIEYHHVGGVWDNNQNVIEATTVVEKVVMLLQTKPGKEIGIVTFNAPQQNLIQDMLEQRAMAERLTIPSSLFIKNIENVQGDEKDIIIFSVGYAPDKESKMRMQFGSLSMTGGENRLNVAVTRAREKIILVCSIHPEEIRVDDIKNEGPRLLRDYLMFAREVYERKYQPHVAPSVTKSWTWYLNEQLRQWSESRFDDVKFDVNCLPLADLHFSKAGKHLGIIMTDDARYYSSLSVKDSFAYVPNLLQQKNWDYHMVFSRNLWQDREKVQDNLLRFIGTRVVTAAEN
ncbi:MAG TPA: DEAD/DEAH box helicase, partial [Chryseosolibacter sp.]|nr:DEAD/DEAH box helicase [Chryseosolibacter sp.]